MRSIVLSAGIAIAALLAGCENPQDSNKPLDQSKIISVRPAVPDGARRFVEEQNKLQQERQRKSKTQAAQPAGYTYIEPAPAKPANNGSWTDIFNPAKWGKGNQDKPQQSQQPKVATSQPS